MVAAAGCDGVEPSLFRLVLFWFSFGIGVGCLVVCGLQMLLLCLPVRLWLLVVVVGGVGVKVRLACGGWVGSSWWAVLILGWWA